MLAEANSFIPYMHSFARALMKLTAYGLPVSPLLSAADAPYLSLPIDSVLEAPSAKAESAHRRWLHD